MRGTIKGETAKLVSTRDTRPYLIVITESDQVGSFNGHTIYRITSTQIIPFNPSQQLEEFQLNDEKKYLQILNHILSLHIYFSYSMDLTNSLQRLNYNTTLTTPHWESADSRFFWNHHLLSPLIAPPLKPFHARDELSQWKLDISDFILPIMMGFIGLANVDVEGKLAQLVVISRRNIHRPGTRYMVRGIDAEGNAANFVETEQIWTVDPYQYSFIQTRASIPLFWRQPITGVYMPKVHIDMDPKVDQAIRCHFKSLEKVYGKDEIVCISLIDQHGCEAMLAKIYEQKMRGSDLNHIRFIAFDFHSHCKGMKYENLAFLAKEMESSMKKIQWFKINKDKTADQERIQGQQGVVRVNCVDNLDRTNVVQSILAKSALISQCQDMDCNEKMINFIQSPAFEYAFQNIWADNGDAISLQYAGSAALKSDYTRTGRRGIKGMITDGYKSMIRYWVNNFGDGFKQDGFNLFLGRYQVEKGKISPYLNDRGREQFVNWMLVSMMLMVLVGISPALLSHSKLAISYWTVIVVSVFLGQAQCGPHLVNLPLLMDECDQSITKW